MDGRTVGQAIGRADGWAVGREASGRAGRGGADGWAYKSRVNEPGAGINFLTAEADKCSIGADDAAVAAVAARVEVFVGAATSSDMKR